MKQTTEGKQYLEPVGFKGTPGKLSIQKEDDRYLHIEIPDGTTVASCYCEPMDASVEYDAKLFRSAKELAKALQMFIKHCEKSNSNTFFFEKEVKNAKQVLKDAGLTDK